MGGWAQGKGKQSSWPGWGTWPHPKKQKEKKEGKGKGAGAESKEPEFPTYESLRSTTSSSSASSAGKTDQWKQGILDFLQSKSLRSTTSSSSASSAGKTDQWKQGILDFLQSKDIEPEGQLKELLEGGPLDDIKSEQRTLNTRKKLLAKLDKLKAKVTEKKEAWQAFLQKSQEHHLKQEETYKADVKALEQAIMETQADLNKITAREQDSMDVSSKEDKMDTTELKRQLADSHARIQYLQQKMESYAMGVVPQPREFPFNDKSPQVNKFPQTILPVGEGGVDRAEEARLARFKALEDAKKRLEAKEIPSRTPSRERSPRRDASNSLERMG